MRLFKLLAMGGLLVGSNFAVPAYAQETVETKPPVYVVKYQCQSGQFARIVTHDANLNDALQKLSKGEVTPAQVLDYVAQNAAQELDRTIVFLDVCVGVKFRRT